MRIISGKHRSRIIEAPKGEKTRPTSDRARESLFNILTNLIDLEGVSVLDLFAGSGAFALEALSRGAGSATGVEANQHALNAMKANAAALGEPLKIAKADVYKYITLQQDSYDIIFADPPYEDPNLPEVLLKLIAGSRLLTPDSIVIIEHRTGSDLTIPPNLVVIRERSAGEATFTFLQLRALPHEHDTTGDLPGDL